MSPPATHRSLILRTDGAGVTRLTNHLSVDVLALDQALEALSAIDAQQCSVVELRFFAGLNIAEAAEALEISPATVEREWALAKRGSIDACRSASDGVRYLG